MLHINWGYCSLCYIDHLLKYWYLKSDTVFCHYFYFRVPFLPFYFLIAILRYVSKWKRLSFILNFFFFFEDAFSSQLSWTLFCTLNQLRYVLPLVCLWSSATHIWSQLFLAPSQKSLLCLNWDLTVISVFELHLFPLDFIYFLYQYLRLYICVWSPSIQIDFKFHKGSSHIYFISQGRFSTYHSAWPKAVVL